MKTTFKFPKTVMAVAGAAALVVSTGFVTVDQKRVKSSEGENLINTTYRPFFSCIGNAGNCLPTFCCVTPDE